MSKVTQLLSCMMCLALGSCAAISGRPSTGTQEDIGEAERAAMTRIGEKVKGKIVWSSSRAGNHNLVVMNPDGSNIKMITQGETVDWFSRFSPDGKRILFCRSKKGWVYERDANRHFKWNLFTIDPEGKDLKMVAKDACWGTWIGENKIMFNRGTQVFEKDLGGDEETLILDSKKEESLGGADLQQPQLSPDGKCLAITLRGARRATGLFDLENKSWTPTGQGCQINWHPDGKRIYWINPSGNGGSEAFSIPVSGCKPTKEYEYEEMKFIDIPGRQSHEYFPQMTSDGKWLVWAATRRGHDHDVADYDIFIWEIGRPAEEATRLTFHSGNDRWPHLFLTGK